MKKRVLVMNGSRIVQSDNGEGWSSEKVEKAGSLKAGIYNIYTASPADKKQPSAGVIVHADKDSVYQQCGKKFIVHSRKDFDIVAPIGSAKSIEYKADGRAEVSDSSIKQSRSRSR
ncbi:MAG: conjugal transfer protein TraO [Candidatus Thiodiazotropha sp. (ex Dulcina madagascariensis)]|nr:conjugal transfer protein TraO [Candidatus Thiodiazotropha sp. (ex Dulcina madagascariensis)]